MAALKDTVVSGSLRATDTLYSTTAQFQILKAPTVSSGSTYGAGSNGQILRTNGTSTYWGDLNDVAPAINGVYYGTCTTAAATQAKEVTLVNGTNFTLAAGTMIVVKFTYASAASTMTLNVAGTGAKTIYMYGTTLASSGTTTSGWAANAIVMFIYDGTSWFRQYWYNTTYDLSQVLSGSATAGYNIDLETSANGGLGQHRYVLMMMTTNQKWSAISAVSGSTTADQGTAVAKVASTANFLIDSPIMYTNTNTYIAPGGSGPFNGYTAIAHNFRYSIGTTAANVSLSYQKPIYLVGIPNNDGATFKLDSTQWWTQTLPTTNDGKIYIYLGLAYTASNIYLNAYHPVFCHNGTNVVPYISGGVMRGDLYVGISSDTTLRSICATSNSGRVCLYSTGNSDGNGNRGVLIAKKGSNGQEHAVVIADANNQSRINLMRNSDGFINLYRYDVTRGTAPSENKYWSISFNDNYSSTTKRLALFDTRYNTDGSVSVEIVTQTPASESTNDVYRGIIVTQHSNATSLITLRADRVYHSALNSNNTMISNELYDTNNIIYNTATPTIRNDGTALQTGDIWLKPIS